MTRTPSTRLPTIKLGPRLTARDAWIGQHPREIWPILATSDSTGFTLRRTINPAPPRPKISLVLIFGSTTTAATSAAQTFVQDFGYTHLDIISYLHRLGENVEYAVHQKLLGDLHPLALRDRLRQELWPSGRFAAGILRRRFEVEGGNVRKWVVTGLPEVEEFVLKVGRAICRLEAAVFVDRPEEVIVRETWVRSYFERRGRAVVVKAGERDVRQAMIRLLCDRALKTSTKSTEEAASGSGQLRDTIDGDTTEADVVARPDTPMEK